MDLFQQSAVDKCFSLLLSKLVDGVFKAVQTIFSIVRCNSVL